jgi:hypothetical protein
MALSNAEKQKLWRDRRNTRAERTEAMASVLADENSKLRSELEFLAQENSLLRQAAQLVQLDLAKSMSRRIVPDDNVDEIAELLSRCIEIFDDLLVREGSHEQASAKAENEEAKTDREYRHSFACDARPDGCYRPATPERARPSYPT